MRGSRAVRMRELLEHRKKTKKKTPARSRQVYTKITLTQTNQTYVSVSIYYIVRLMPYKQGKRAREPTKASE